MNTGIPTLADYVATTKKVRELQKQYFAKSSKARKMNDRVLLNEAAELLIESKKYESFLDKSSDDMLIRAQQLEQRNNQLSPSEAVFGVLSWLTTRDEVLTISHIHDAAPVATVANEYCEKQGFDLPRENWTDYAKPMHNAKADNEGQIPQG